MKVFWHELGLPELRVRTTIRCTKHNTAVGVLQHGSEVVSERALLQDQHVKANSGRTGAVYRSDQIGDEVARHWRLGWIGRQGIVVYGDDDNAGMRDSGSVREQKRAPVGRLVLDPQKLGANWRIEQCGERQTARYTNNKRELGKLAFRVGPSFVLPFEGEGSPRACIARPSSQLSARRLRCHIEEKRHEGTALTRPGYRSAALTSLGNRGQPALESSTLLRRPRR